MATHDFIKNDFAEKNWTYLKVPKIFFFEDQYKEMSDGAIVLYSLFLERAITDGQKDENGILYIFYSAQEIMDAIHCSINTTTKYLKELEKIGLVERRIRGQGKPTMIYVKEFYEKSTANYKYAFFFVPMSLFKEDRYRRLTPLATILYAIILERSAVFMLKGSADNRSSVYLQCSLQEIARELNCTVMTASNLLKALNDCNLIKIDAGNPEELPRIYPLRLV